MGDSIQRTLTCALDLPVGVVGLMSEYATEPPVDATDPFLNPDLSRNAASTSQRLRRTPEPRGWHTGLSRPALVHVPPHTRALGRTFKAVAPPRLYERNGITWQDFHTQDNTIMSLARLKRPHQRDGKTVDYYDITPSRAP